MSDIRRVETGEIAETVLEILPDWKDGPWDRELVEIESVEWREINDRMIYSVGVAISGIPGNKQQIRSLDVRIVTNGEYVTTYDRTSGLSGQDQRYARIVGLLIVVVSFGEFFDYMNRQKD